MIFRNLSLESKLTRNSTFRLKLYHWVYKWTDIPLHTNQVPMSAHCTNNSRSFFKLRYNVYNIKYTILKCTTQCLLVFYNLVQSLPYLIPEHFYQNSPKYLVPVSSHSQFPTFAHNHEFAFSMYSMWMKPCNSDHLFLAFLLRIMFLRFIHVVIWISTSFFFILE